MPPIRELSPNAMSDPDATGVAAHLPGYAELLLRVLAIRLRPVDLARHGPGAGDGADRPLRQADAVDIRHRAGRCRSAAGLPSAAGGIGLVWLAAGRERWPTRAALMALVTFLPVLLVIILGDGYGHTLAMRVAGVALMLCSLVYAAYRYRSQLPPGLQGTSSSLPVSRLVTAWYGGGLWLCAMARGGLESSHGPYPWTLLLLALALLLGLLEGLRWQASCWRPGEARVDGVAAPFIASSSRPVKVAPYFCLTNGSFPR